VRRGQWVRRSRGRTWGGAAGGNRVPVSSRPNSRHAASLVTVLLALTPRVAPHLYAIGLLNTKHTSGTTGFDFSVGRVNGDGLDSLTASEGRLTGAQRQNGNVPAPVRVNSTPTDSPEPQEDARAYWRAGPLAGRPGQVPACRAGQRQCFPVSRCRLYPKAPIFQLQAPSSKLTHIQLAPALRRRRRRGQHREPVQLDAQHHGRSVP
jgi:hypothetical protein